MSGPETSTADETAENDAAKTAAAKPSSKIDAPRRRGRMVPWLLVILTTAALVFVTLQWLPLRASEGERLDVATSARDVVTRLTTWDARTGLENTISGLAAVGTPSFAADVDRFFAGPAGDELVSSGAASTALIKDIFVQSIDGDNATVFVVLDQSISTLVPQANNVLPRRAVVELVRADGRWLAEDIIVTDGVFTVPDEEVVP